MIERMLEEKLFVYCKGKCGAHDVKGVSRDQSVVRVRIGFIVEMMKEGFLPEQLGRFLNRSSNQILYYFREYRVRMANKKIQRRITNE